MTLEDVLSDLLKLNRADKLRAIQLLAHEIADEDTPHLTPGATYEIWSPYDSAKTASELSDLLKKHKQSKAKNG